MMRLIEAIKQQKISAIVSESLDRISRNLGETDAIYQLCTYYGIPIFTVMEGSHSEDTRGPIGDGKFDFYRTSRSSSETRASR